MKHLQPINNILTAQIDSKSLNLPKVDTGQALDLEGVEKALKGFDAYLKAAASSTGLSGLDGSVQTQEALQPGKISPHGGKNMPLPSSDVQSTVAGAQSSVAVASTEHQPVKGLFANTDTKSTDTNLKVTNRIDVSTDNVGADTSHTESVANGKEPFIAPGSTGEARADAGLQPQPPESYITAAQNLVERLSDDPQVQAPQHAGIEPASGISPGQGAVGTGSGLSDNAGYSESYGLFESPIYKSMVAGNKHVENVAKQAVATIDRSDIRNQTSIKSQTSAESVFGQMNTAGDSAKITHRNSPGIPALSDDIRNLLARADALSSTGAQKVDTQVKFDQSGLVGSSPQIQNSRAQGPQIQGGPGSEPFSLLPTSNRITPSDSVLSQNLTPAIPDAVQLSGQPLSVGQAKEFLGIDTMASFGDSGTKLSEHALDQSASKLATSPHLTADTKMAEVKTSDLNQQALQMKMETRVMQDGWNGEFAMKVRSMASSLNSAGEQQASLHLRPSELGSIEITMTTEGDKAKVHFVVQTAGAREALENSLPRLREFFEESGMTLSDTGVEDQSGRAALTDQQGNEQANPQTNSNDEPEGTNTDQQPSGEHSVINGQLENAIDYYI